MLNTLLPRPAYKSDFNYTNYTTRGTIRGLIAVLAIRELPIKSFYARCWIVYLYMYFFYTNGLMRGHGVTRHVCLYGLPYHAKTLANYPEIGWNVIGRPLAENPPVHTTHMKWRYHQQPAFHQVHRQVYRFRYRKPRYVSWDGSMNQPVMPFIHDMGTGVPNGTFRMNCNSSPQCH